MQRETFPFHERIHSAYKLNTTVTFYLEPEPTDNDISWLLFAYPKSVFQRGNDQGANYLTIKPDK